MRHCFPVLLPGGNIALPFIRTWAHIVESCSQRLRNEFRPPFLVRNGMSFMCSIFGVLFFALQQLVAQRSPTFFVTSLTPAKHQSNTNNRWPRCAAVCFIQALTPYVITCDSGPPVYQIMFYIQDLVFLQFLISCSDV